MIISYKEITQEQIEKMSLSELNKYIESYGKVLQSRFARVEKSTESNERQSAINFIKPSLKNISKVVSLSGMPEADSDIKEFSEILEARARLKNLVRTLRSSRSTITGQKKIYKKQRAKTRSYIKKMLGKKAKGVIGKISAADLDELRDVFATLSRDDVEVESYEVIDSFIAVKDKISADEDIAEVVKRYLGDKYGLKDKKGVII